MTIQTRIEEPKSAQPGITRRTNPDETRHDWTRAELQALFDLPFNDLLFEAQLVHRRRTSRCATTARNDAAARPTPFPTLATTSTVTVPVYIRDVDGTSLDVDKPGTRIQAYSFRIFVSPDSAFQKTGPNIRATVIIRWRMGMPPGVAIG